MDLGSTTKILRQASNVSVRTLAKRMGVSPAYLSQLENGKVPPTQKRVAQIERVLGLPSGYLQQMGSRPDDPRLEFMAKVPESFEFIEAAHTVGLKGEDFNVLSEALLDVGLGQLRRELREMLARAKRRAAPSPAVKQRSGAVTVSRYLEAPLIFRFTKAKRKGELLSFLAGKLAERAPGTNADELYAKLIAKDNDTNTGVGGGVAIPHCSSSAVDKNYVALALFPQGIHWGSIDNKPVHAVFLVVGPEKEREEHVQLLARIARLFSKHRFAEKLVKNAKPADVIGFFEKAARTIR